MKSLFWAILIVGLSFISYAYSGVSRQYYTFSPEVEISGPIAGRLSRTEYQQQVFRITLEEAHAMASEYLEYRDYTAYWAFIMGSLITPFHESRNLHFREVENIPGNCRQSANNGSLFNSLPQYQKVFFKYFKKKKAQVFPNCKDLKKESDLIQLVHGADGSDLGIMQVNLRWHEKNYVALGLYADLRASIRYGLGIFNKGFEAIYRKKKSYSCIYKKKRVNRKNFLHAIWAGVYNSGNSKASCRWTKADNEWKANDEAFKESARAFYQLADTKFRNAVYPLPEKESTLLKSIISQSHGAKTFPQEIFDYLATPIQFSAEDEVMTFHELMKANGSVEMVTTSNVQVRKTAPLGIKTGVTLKAGTPVKVVRYFQKEKETWYQIAEPAKGWVYGQFVEME